VIAAAAARCRARVSVLAESALAGARGERDLVRLLAAVWGVVGEELARREDGAPPPACGPGCSTCCRLNVGTLAVEGAAAAAHLRALAPDPAARAAELAAFHDRVRWLEDRQRLAERLACPLLDAGGRCSIHAARPLACRSVSSLDPADCRRAVSASGDDEEDPPLVRMDLLQKALHDAAWVALAEALAVRGLDARARDVSGMTAAFLADPALAASFLAGGRVPLP
jgi:hypothetical protein